MNTPLRAPEKDNFQEQKSCVLQVILEGCAFVPRRLKYYWGLLGGLQFMTDMSLCQTGFALGRSTPQLILMLAEASS